MPSTATLLRIAPVLFVLIWSTGWISARFGAPYADPLTFLAIRYTLAAAVIVAFASVAGASWPRGGAVGHAMASGVLLHGIYLGGVWWAIRHGLPTGVSGLIAAVQPILTALLAPALIGERISRLQWAGIALGFAGIALVLEPQLETVTRETMAAVVVPMVVNVVAMVSVTFGTFYQKRFIATGDLRTVTALQYVGAFLVTLPAALLLEEMRISGTSRSSPPWRGRCWRCRSARSACCCCSSATARCRGPRR